MIRRAFSILCHQRRRLRPSDALAGVTLAMFVALSAPGIPALADAAPGEAMAEVKSTVDQVLEILKNPEYKSAAAVRRQKLRDVIGVHFDFADMSRSALGVHWKSLSQDQRSEFVPVFKNLMEAVYMSRIESYSGQEIKILREKSDNSDYAEVYTSIAQEAAQPISVNYRLKRTDQGWKVYDVIVDGISLVANYRNQFNRVINSKGYAELVRQIKARSGESPPASGKSS